ncbi:efflux RND transporter periplasmic adaptor subunit [Sabulicella glaciei]|nr:efflux RND transporter periplasmic adaptor subunit [Roseococcus sp. MDT2-1-1]
MRRPLAFLLILPLLAGGAYLWGAPALGVLGLGAAAEAGPRLRLAEADRGTITAVVSATGTVNPVNSVIVGSQLSGQIREVMADWNTRVTAGQALARLDTQQLEATRAAAQADLLAARAAVVVARAQAERAAADAGQARAAVAAAKAEVQRSEALLRDATFERNRTEELRRSGVGAVRDATRAGFTFEGAQAALATQRAQAEQAEANQLSAEAAARTAAAQVETAEAQAEQRAAVLRQVEVNLSFTVIRSPIDGIVVSRSVDLGQTVAASLQAPTLFTIAANLDEMEVWATVDEADIGRIRTGQSVTFTVAAHPQLNLRGTVKDIRLTPATVNNVVTYTVIIAAPNNNGRMLPGMTATLRIVADERRDVLRVPNAALRWRPAGQSATAANAPPESPMAAALRQMEDLSPTQRQEVEAALAEMRERMAAMPGEAEARRQGMQAARQRLQSRLNAVLTPEQRARLAAARGGGGGRGGATGTVWVVEREGTAPRAVPVRIGLSDGSVTEILSGEIAEGAQVVTGTERASGTAGRAPPSRNLF